MKDIINEVLSYVKAGLNDIKINEPISDEQMFYNLVKENGLSAIVFNALDKTVVSNKLYQKIEANFYEYVKKDTRQLLLHQKLKSILNDAKIDYIFLKGTNLKYLYPKSYFRAMGDIDCLVKKTDISKVHEQFSKNKIKCISRSMAHDVFSTIDGLEIEIHPGFLADFNEKYLPLISNPWSHSLHVDKNEHRFDASYEVCYLVYHLAKHIQFGGVGLRSVLDIGIYLRAYQNEIDEKKILKLLEQSDMARFFQTVLYLNEKLFSIKLNFNFMNEFFMTEELYSQLVEYISLSGIHGLGRSFNSFEARLVTQKRKKRGKLGLIFNRMFPSLTEMRGIYPILRKWAILLPVFYVVRLFKLVFKNPKTNINKVKKIKKARKLTEIEDFFEKIGI